MYPRSFIPEICFLFVYTHKSLKGSSRIQKFSQSRNHVITLAAPTAFSIEEVVFFLPLPLLVEKKPILQISLRSLLINLTHALSSIGEYNKCGIPTPATQIFSWCACQQNICIGDLTIGVTKIFSKRKKIPGWGPDLPTHFFGFWVFFSFLNSVKLFSKCYHMNSSFVYFCRLLWSA